MIRLEVEEYCHNCFDFNPDVIKPQRVTCCGEEAMVTDTVVRCEHRRRCMNIRRYLEQQLKETEGGEG